MIATVGGLRRFESDDAVSIRIPPESIHLFDAESSAALHNRQLESADTVPGV